MNKDIHEGFVTACHRIGGAELAPYSAAHAFALEASGWTLADLASAGGIIRFVDICRRPIGENCLPVDWIKTGPGLRLSAWGVALALSPKLHKEAVDAVHAYLEDCLATPRVYRPQNHFGSGPNGSDILFRVLSGMKLGLSEHRAWSMPLGSLNSYLVHSEALTNKDAIIADPDQEAAIERAFAEAMKK